MKKFAKMAAIVAMAASTLVLSGCGESDDPPMDKLVMRYKAIVQGRYMNRHIEFANVTVSNVRCKKQDIAIACTVDGAGEVSIRNSLNGTVETKKLDDKNVEMRFLNRDAVHK